MLVTLDTGALIAIERGKPRGLMLLGRSRASEGIFRRCVCWPCDARLGLQGALSTIGVDWGLYSLSISPSTTRMASLPQA